MKNWNECTVVEIRAAEKQKAGFTCIPLIVPGTGEQALSNGINSVLTCL